MEAFQHSRQVISATLAMYQHSPQAAQVVPVSHHKRAQMQQGSVLDTYQPMQLACPFTAVATVWDPPRSRTLRARKHFMAILCARQVPRMVAELVTAHQLPSLHSLHSQ